MKRINIEVTLTFKGDAWVNEDCIEFDADVMSKVLGEDTYSDGRHNFSQEMMSHGLHDQVKRAVSEAVFSHFEQRIGRERLYTEYSEGKVAYTCPLYRKMAAEWMEANPHRFFIECTPFRAQVVVADSA
jgi:hypothetical protein